MKDRLPIALLYPPSQFHVVPDEVVGNEIHKIDVDETNWD